jgi:hypothetical protein
VKLLNGKAGFQKGPDNGSPMNQSQVNRFSTRMDQDNLTAAKFDEKIFLSDRSLALPILRDS